MAQIKLSNLRHSYQPNPASDADYALKKIDLTWDDGGAMPCLVRPGCGKSTLLNIIPACWCLLKARSCSTIRTSPRCRRQSAISRRCSSFRSSTTR